MPWRRSRGIHAARPTAHRLRSACTKVALWGDWASVEEDQDQRHCIGRRERIAALDCREVYAALDAPRRRGRSEPARDAGCAIYTDQKSK